MSSRPTSEESLHRLHRLQQESAERGDHSLALLLTGVEVHVRAGRELELLHLMRQSAEELGEAVANTPTAEDLRRLFESP
jgi:hypothetical protein